MTIEVDEGLISFIGKDDTEKKLLAQMRDAINSEDVTNPASIDENGVLMLELDEQ